MKINIDEYRILKPAVVKFLIREGASEFKMSEAAAVIGCPVVAVYVFACEEKLINSKVRDDKLIKLSKFYKYEEILGYKK